MEKKIFEKKYIMEVIVDKDKNIFIIMNFIFIYYVNIFRKEILYLVFIIYFISKFYYIVFILNWFFKLMGKIIL